MGIGPDAEIARRDATLRADRRGFGDDEAGATDRAAAQMHEMPVVGHAVDR